MYDEMSGHEFDVVGYDEYGNLVGVARPSGRAPSGGRMQRGPQTGRQPSSGSRTGPGGRPGLPPGVQAPQWWKGTAGVNQPNEMLHVMPLTPDQGNGVFTAATTAAIITWKARPQKPFRGERIISQVTPFGPTATAQAQSTSIQVGVDLQQVQAGNIPLSVWAATAFGVRLAMVDAEPGIEISMPVQLVGAALLTTDTITVALTVLGRVLA